MKIKKVRRLSMDLTKDRGGHVKILPVEQTFGCMPPVVDMTLMYNPCIVWRVYDTVKIVHDPVGQ